MVGQLAKQRLGFWVTPSQGVKADALTAEIYLATYQSVDPMWVDLAGVSEQVDGAGIVAAAHEDHPAFERRVEVQFEAFWKRATSGGTVASQGGLGPMRGNIAVRDLDQAYHIGAMVAPPDLALPKTIESFDGVLQARLAGGANTGMTCNARQRRLIRPTASAN